MGFSPCGLISSSADYADFRRFPPEKDRVPFVPAASLVHQSRLPLLWILRAVEDRIDRENVRLVSPSTQGWTS
jgi:hypothetical protein